MKLSLLWIIIIAVLSSSAEAACPTFNQTIRKIFFQPREFDYEKFKSFKSEYQALYADGKTVTAVPNTLEEKAALLDVVIAKNNHPTFSIEEVMKNPARSERKSLLAEVDRIFSPRKKTEFRSSLRMDRLYLSNIQKTYPGFFDRVTPEVVETQFRLMLETRIAKENVATTLKEMGLIREPNAFNEFAKKILNETTWSRMEIPKKYLEMALSQGFDHAWNGGLQAYMTARYAQGFARELLYQKTLGAFTNISGKYFWYYALYQAGDKGWEDIKTIMLAEKFEEALENQKKVEPDMIKDIPTEMSSPGQKKAWDIWVKSHPEEAKDPTSEKYQNARRLIYGE